MAIETEQDGVQDGAAAVGADDLSAALSDSSDPGFVTGQAKKQLSPGTLAVGGLIVVAAAVVYFMYLRNGPDAAIAAQATTSTATTTINQFLSGGGQNADEMKQMLKDSEKIVQQFRNDDPAKKQIPIDALKTNPFRQSAEGKASPKVEEDAAKKRKDELLKAAQALKLQTVIHGGKRKAAMINGVLYLEGQQVGEFTVEKISPGSVVVRSGKSGFELKMQR